MSLLFVDELGEDIVDRAPDKGSEVQELAVNTMKSRLQEIALTRIFTVKKFQQLCPDNTIDEDTNCVSSLLNLCIKNAQHCATTKIQCWRSQMSPRLSWCGLVRSGFLIYLKDKVVVDELLSHVRVEVG